MRITQPNRALDRRQRKTRTAIQNALLALLREKTIDAITISELTSRAAVNRKTFYNHYTNLQQVRSELEQQYMDLFFSYIDSTPQCPPNSQPIWFIHCLMDDIRTQPERSRLLFESGEYLSLAHRFKELSMPRIREMAERCHLRMEYLDCSVEYMLSGLMSALNLWIHSDPQLPPEEFEQLAAGLLCSCTGLLGFSEEPEKA